MEYPAETRVTIDAEMRVPAATAQLIRFDMAGPVDAILREEESYRLDLCITPRPRNARACYRDHWNPHRFERIGKIFLLLPRETMQVCSDGDCSQTSIVCQLSPQLMRAWFEDELPWSDRLLEASLDIQDENIRGLLLRLSQETRRPGFASEVLVEMIAGQVAIELGRYCGRINKVAVSGGLAPWCLRLIDERLREVRKAPTLAELAGLCKLSVRQLTRGFRTSRSCSIGDYMANSRIDHAKRMLLSEQSIKSIASSLGFSSPSSFCFAFRRATGVTPREFRQRVPRG